MHHVFFHSVPIFHSAPKHYAKMLLLSGVSYNNVLHFLVVHRHITKNALQNMWCITKTRMVSSIVSHCTLSLYLIYVKMDGYVNTLFILQDFIQFWLGNWIYMSHSLCHRANMYVLVGT